MPTAVLSQTLREPTTAEVRQFIMTGDFTQGSGIKVQATIDVLNDGDGSVNRTMSFEFNASAGQKDHFASDVAAAMNNLVSDIETILGVTFA